MTRRQLTPLEKIIANRDKNKARILKLIQEGCTTTSIIAQQTGLTRGNVNDLVRALHRERQICRIPFPLREGRDGIVYVSGWKIGADTDAAIERANSCGPMLDHSGICQVITKARQIGMFRHWLDTAFFGPAGVMA